MRVEQLWRYPVKSLGGERVESCPITDTGLDGDRAWGIVDQTTGHVLTARREPRLLFANARLTGADSVEILLPDGSRADSDGSLSAWLGRTVRLQRAGTSGGTYENPLDFENESDWVSWQGPPGAWHDMKRARVSLLSTATLGHWDVRRFRPNILLAGDGEDALVGRRIKVGDAILAVAKRIDRCIMVTRAQPGIERDLDILREINRDRQTFLAVGALVDTPGVVQVGDCLVDLTSKPDRPKPEQSGTDANF